MNGANVRLVNEDESLRLI